MSFEEWLQSRLTAHGYPVGEIDGIVGPVTRTAIRQFQEDRDLEITGTATAETVMWLRRSSVGDVPRPPEDPAAGPDPSLRWPTQAEVPGFYGMIGMSQQRLRLPYPMRLSWNRAILIDSISVHSLVLESAGRALEMIASMYSPLQRTELGLDIFGGSLNVRQVRGGTAWSMHSWGIAIDFDPVRNMMNWRSDRARLARPDAEPFWAAWESQGWVSLGRERNYDWMHVQAARL